MLPRPARPIALGARASGDKHGRAAERNHPLAPAPYLVTYLLTSVLTPAAAINVVRWSALPFRPSPRRSTETRGVLACSRRASQPPPDGRDAAAARVLTRRAPALELVGRGRSARAAGPNQRLRPRDGGHALPASRQGRSAAVGHHEQVQERGRSQVGPRAAAASGVGLPARVRPPLCRAARPAAPLNGRGAGAPRAAAAPRAAPRCE